MGVLVMESNVVDFGQYFFEKLDEKYPVGSSNFNMFERRIANKKHTDALHRNVDSRTPEQLSAYNTFVELFNQKNR